jgi:hypothetical protein
LKNVINPILIKLNRVFTATPNTIRPYRWLIIFLFSIVTFICTWNLSNIKMDMSLESFFAEDDPFLKGYDQFKKDFGSDDSIYLVFEAKDGDIFSEKSIRLTHELTEDLENWRQIQGLEFLEESMLKRMVKITSLTNSRYQLVRGDDLISAKMVRDTPPKTQEELKTFKELAQTQENFEGFLYAKSRDYGGLSIKTDFGMTLKEPIDTEETGDMDLEDIGMEDDFSMEVDEDVAVAEVEFADEDFNNYVLLMTDFKKIINQPKYQEHFNFHALGNPPLYDWSMSMMGEMGILALLLIVIIIGLLWSLLRSFAAVLWPILIIIMSSLMVVGGSAILGVSQSTMVSLTIMLIITVGVAASVHVMSTYLIYRREDKDHEEALTLSYRKTGVPILITSLTTMGGMLSIGGTGLPFMVVFAFQSAAGIALTWLMIWTLLPNLMDIWHPLKGKRGSEQTAKIGFLGHIFSAMWLQPLLDRIPNFVSRRPYKLTVIFLCIVGLFTYGATKVKVDTNLVELSDEESDLNRAYKIVDEKMSGGQSMEILFEFEETDSLKDTRILVEIDKLEQHLIDAYPDLVRKTFSMARMLKDTNRVMHGNDQMYYRIPSDQTLTNQLMYLLSNANPEDRRSLVNDNYTKTHITVQVNNAGSFEYTQFFDDVKKDIETQFEHLRESHPDMQIRLAGALPMLYNLSQEMSEAQMDSFFLAIVVISCLMMITLGSMQGGLISILPNVIPALTTFGAMGLMGVPLDGDTLFIAPVIIGLAVDDTIHLIAHYRDSLLHGKDHELSIRETIKEVGQAVTFTTLILGLGFGVMAFSSYGGMSKIGVYGSLGIFTALLCDLFFLPALLTIFKPKMGTDGQQMPASYKGAI